MIIQKTYTECVGTSMVQSKNAQSAQSDDDNSSIYPGYIAVPENTGARVVLIQAYVNPEELGAVGKTFDDIAGVPLVTINETDLPNATLDANGNLLINGIQVGGYSTPGQKLLNFGEYLIENATNITNAMIIPFDKNINVYLVFTYFK